MSTQARQQFVEFLERIAAGADVSEEWAHLAVAHYADLELESARSQLVKASLGIDSRSWLQAPIAMRRVAAELAERFRVSGT
ncbi:MAG: hypothetical protein JNN30_11880 [Rhodanobacteraceae bacterium]|nr:hypothetical protein [Rhodanobacteraceae bacterium]